MIPPTFEAAIANIFKEKSTETLETPAELNDSLGLIKETEHINVLYDEVTAVFEETINAIKAGTILLIDLIQNRQAIYQAAEKIRSLAIKEQQDVTDLEKEMQWHEKSSFARLFVTSDKGDQLDQEKEEAKIAKSITKQFADSLTEFESFLDEYILDTGMKYDHNFLLLVEEWKELSKLKESLFSARKHIRQGQSKLKTSVSCGESSCSVDNSRSKKHFSSAIRQLDKQIEVFKPIAEQLTEKVEIEVLRVRTQLLIN